MGKSWPKGKCFGSVQNRRMAGQIVFLNRKEEKVPKSLEE